MIFEKHLNFRAIALTVLAVMLLPAAVSVADDADDRRLRRELEQQQERDIELMESVLENPEEAAASIENPQQTLQSVKNSPYNETFNKAYGDCVMGIFPAMALVMGLSGEDYFTMDNKKIAMLRSCMAKRGYHNVDFGQRNISPPDAGARESQEDLQEALQELGDAQEALEAQRRSIAQYGAAGIAPDMEKNFLVPLTPNGGGAGVYKFDKKSEKDR